MTDDIGGLWITFNGEIYNYVALREQLHSMGHRFATATDTEVILAAYRQWGEDCVNHLQGMFAFGLYDTTRRRMLLGRDRAGEKPIFYHLAAGKLSFASELKALLLCRSVPRVLDMDALNYYLTFGYIPGDGCILRDVHKLSQGSAMTFDIETGVLKVWRYWRLPEGPSSHQGATDDELVDELESLLAASVRQQVVADVPVGVMLSGGIDSTLVTALAARVSSEPVRTFTVSFPKHQAFDEAPHARLVARHFGTDHIELEADSTSAVALLPRLARQFDEPIADSSMLPMYLVSQLIRQHATVALGGDGGDELFGGYSHYTRLQQAERLRPLVPGPVRSIFGAAAASWLPAGFKGRHYVMGFVGDARRSIASVNVIFDTTSRSRLLRPAMRSLRSPLGAPEAYKVGLCGAGSALRQATAVDFQTYLVDDILVKVDRASMLASLEVRAPWLDHRIIEFAFARVPDRLRATAKGGKVLCRLLAGRLLPAEFDVVRKQGFSIPFDSWFKDSWGDYISEVLSEAEANLFDKAAIQALLAGQRRGFANANRLFALTMFELWRREYRIDTGSDDISRVA